VLEIFDERVCALGEAPYYDRRGNRVGWVDLPAQRVLWRDPDTGATGEVVTPEPVSAAVPRVAGGLVLCLADGPVLSELDGTLQVLGAFAEADAAAGIDPAGRPAVRANDAKPDPVGRLWVGTLALDGTPGAGALYRFDPSSGIPHRVIDGVSVANGLGWAPDGRTMYFADTGLGRVDAFDYDLATGEPSRRRPFVDFAAFDRTAPVVGDTGDGPAGGAAPVAADPGVPDGLCVDADGGVWVACWGGGQVLRFTPDGVLERRVPVPTPLVTSCAFVGAELDRLVITTAAIRDSAGRPGAGITYAHRPGDVVGQLVGQYGG